MEDRPTAVVTAESCQNELSVAANNLQLSSNQTKPSGSQSTGSATGEYLVNCAIINR